MRKLKKVILVTYDNNPLIGSEAGKAYIWSTIISKKYNTVIYTQMKHQKNINSVRSDLNFRYINSTPFISRNLVKLRLYNYDYMLFLKKAWPSIESEIKEENTIIHFLTPSGIHSFCKLSPTFSTPYLIGPIGGFLRMPKGFLKYKQPAMWLKELFYDVLVQRKAWKTYFRNSVGIVCGTELVMKHLPVDAQRHVTIIHDAAVNTSYFAPAECNKKDRFIRIVYSGRLVLYKGCLILLKAFKLLVEKGVKNIELNFAGSGPEKSSLEKYINRHNLKEYVNLLGHLKRDELKKLLNTSDIYCLPTLKEPGGNAILEAMACELPVVTSNYGGPSYSVTPDCGILINPINETSYVNELAKALSTLIEDKNLRKAMGKAARFRVVSNYSPEVLEENILKFYENVEKKI